MYLSKSQNIFVQITKCICPNHKMYLSESRNVFVEITKYICPNYKSYLSNDENDDERRKVKLASSPATWCQIVHPGESQPKPGGFPHNPHPGFIMHR